MKRTVLQQEQGWTGMFTRARARGALPNGMRVVKAASEPFDIHEAGATGNILGSLQADGALIYFVEWDDRPRFAVGTMAWKIQPCQEAA